MSIKLKLHLWEIIKKLAKEYPNLKSYKIIEEVSPGMFNYEEQLYKGIYDKGRSIIILDLSRDQMGNWYNEGEIVKVIFEVENPRKMVISDDGKPSTSNVYIVRNIL